MACGPSKRSVKEHRGGEGWPCWIAKANACMRMRRCHALQLGGGRSSHEEACMCGWLVWVSPTETHTMCTTQEQHAVGGNARVRAGRDNVQKLARVWIGGLWCRARGLRGSCDGAGVSGKENFHGSEQYSILKLTFFLSSVVCVTHAYELVRC